jgi:hypothetical protein
MRRSVVVVALGLLLGLPSGRLYAQQGTADIAGRVLDEQGAALPGAAILITNEASGVYRETVSGAEGSFRVSQIVPGRYRVSATLTGFRPTEQSGLVVQVGTTLAVTLTLVIGNIDTTAIRVGGNVGTAELAQLPAINRNYFAAVALLPGVQFAPSNQMGNDTIVASGQTSQNNNVSVDGGYNADDALGTSAGAQVRTPLESIQEFQVLTSMYDAEFGRASGAVVNAVTKTGTNQFRGVLFGYMSNNAWISEDYFVRTRNLAKPTTEKREWGGVVGGPIIRNKAHFFFSLERQVDNPNRSRVFSTRPDQDFSIAEDRTNWNTLVRFDHQINANNSWAVRWLREWAPQWNTIGTRQTLESYQDETDLDQTLVGTFTSVLGTSKVNTFRLARTWEHWWHGNECFRAQGPTGDRAGFPFGDEAAGRQMLCAPQLDQISFLGQASTESQGPWDSNLQVENDFSWFIPGKRGDHDLKVGARYNYTELERISQINENGTFRFNTDLPFDSANPRTYPERLTIRMGTFNQFIDNHTWEAFAQDKWRIGPNTTLSIGLRYDLEIIPLDASDNPLFAPGDGYPVDKDNWSPRVGFSHTLDEAGKMVVRAGYGKFYNRTILGAIDDTMEFGKYTTSNVVQFPANAADPGPGSGQFPTNPLLVNGPVVNRALLEQLYPPGVPVKNNGVVVFDSPDRQVPFAHQMTAGFARQLGGSMAVNVDYVKMMNRDMFLARNLNPAVRADTSRTGPIVRVDAFGVLGEPYVQQVWVMENTGESDYDALNLSLEKRYSNNWQARVSYSLSYSRGTAENQADRNTYQFLTDPSLDLWEGPSVVDRRHVLSIGGRTEIPKTKGVTLSTTIRYMTGAPFTIYSSAVDVNRNGELDDPVPAGTYSGTATDSLQNVEFDGKRNGARGPDIFQADIRAGWRHRLGDRRVFEVFFDVFNVTNRANFDNPVVANRDMRLPATFLVQTNLYGGSGFPRQAQLGMRFEF